MFTITTPFKPALDIPMEFGTYVSSELGGILCASSSDNCIAHKTDNIDFHIGNGGECYWDELESSKFNRLPANKISFMSSNNPHESIGGTHKRRSLVRLTLNHKYNNSSITKH